MMSSPSESDSKSGGEDYYPGNNNKPLQTCRQPQPAPALLQWSNHLMGGHHTFLQQHQQHLYNMQAQAAYAAASSAAPAAGGQQETYSVLRMGNGNFLKIYHCPDNLGPMSVDAPFTLSANSYNQHHQPHLQTTYQHHFPQQPSQQQHSTASTTTGTPQMFNSYELFSSNTQLPTPEVTPLLVLGPGNENNQNRNKNTAQTKVSMTINNGNSVSEATSNANAATMIINNLVSNWSPNLTGGVYTQFGSQCSQSNQLQDEIVLHSKQQQNLQTPATVQHSINLKDMNKDEFITATTACQFDENAENQQDSEVEATQTIMPQHIEQDFSKENITTVASIATSTDHAAVSSPPNALLREDTTRQEVPRKRIVAEVKPMRMTYSDVLSKLNNQQEKKQNTSLQNQSNIIQNNRANQKTNNVNVNAASFINNTNNNNNGMSNRRSLDEIAVQMRSTKKSPIHENKENVQNSLAQATANIKTMVSKRPSSMINGNNNTNSTSNANSTASQKQQQTQRIQNNKTGSVNTDISARKRPTNLKRLNDVDLENNCNGVKLHEPRKSSKSISPSTTCNNSSSTTNANPLYGRKSTKSFNLISNSYQTNITNPQQQRSRFQSHSNASYSYSSTKRGRNNSSNFVPTSGNSSPYSQSGAGHKRNYEFAKRFLQTWYIFTMKILTWLFYLIYDIVVLGCSILYEHLLINYESGRLYIRQLHRELKQNSNKPSIWIKNRYRRFDARFSKTSKWAFWRRLYKKKPPESLNETFKDGRLPQTGEEAMYSLLNCKGKDAYSILGVPPNCSQEQIRKHYKKIAVLVHPDKNKQPGAEEAFKVLQRAFELIGEPENRLAYDQSLAEALHAEKAWTELHDLLSQLQTKITEAANTIRCSTCGLRHPRKLADRPHYAARECASCKIRHSAREGDIWAETSMMGLRWKYLALMEGKVYDITEWANCQKGALAHLEPNSHMVQYRIVRGAQQQQHQQRQQQKQQQTNHHQYARSTNPNYATGSGGSSTSGTGKFKCDNMPSSEASLHEFLDNLYSGQHPHHQQNNTTHTTSTRRRRRN